MKALKASAEFWHDVAEPKLREHFPNQYKRIAAGLVGNGSECYGFDDELSEDHDWGIEFMLWLLPEDYDAIGTQLEVWKSELLAANPETAFRTPGKYCLGQSIFSISQFYKQLIGSPLCPQEINEWRRVPENNFAIATNGQVFYDGLGEFTRIREELLGYYPEDLRLKKIAARCLSLAQTGQYNYERSLKRGETIAAELALAQFVSDAISMVFLLNKTFMPFYKWAYRRMTQLPLLAGDVARNLTKLYVKSATAKRAEIIEEICAAIIDELKRQDLSASSSTFLLQHGEEVQAKITDPELKRLPTQYE